MVSVTVVPSVSEQELCVTFFSTLKEFWFLYAALAMLFPFIAFPLLTCNNPSKPVHLNLPWELFLPLLLAATPITNSLTLAPAPSAPSVPCGCHCCLVPNGVPPPHPSCFCQLSNVSEVTAMFSGSQVLGCQKKASSFSFPSFAFLSCYFITLNGVWKKQGNHIRVSKALPWRFRKPKKSQRYFLRSLDNWSVHSAPGHASI